jgi:hypothetical protein
MNSATGIDKTVVGMAGAESHPVLDRPLFENEFLSHITPMLSAL